MAEEILEDGLSFESVKDKYDIGVSDEQEDDELIGLTASLNVFEINLLKECPENIQFFQEFKKAWQVVLKDYQVLFSLEEFLQKKNNSIHGYCGCISGVLTYILRQLMPSYADCIRTVAAQPINVAYAVHFVTIVDFSRNKKWYLGRGLNSILFIDATPLDSKKKVIVDSLSQSLTCKFEVYSPIRYFENDRYLSRVYEYLEENDGNMDEDKLNDLLILIGIQI